MKSEVVQNIPVSVVYEVLFKVAAIVSQSSGGAIHTTIVHTTPNQEIVLRRKQKVIWFTTPSEVTFSALIRFQKEGNSTIVQWNTKWHMRFLDFFGFGFFMVFGAILGAILLGGFMGGFKETSFTIFGGIIGIIGGFGFTYLVDLYVNNGVYEQGYGQLVQTPLNQLRHSFHQEEPKFVKRVPHPEEITNLVDDAKYAYKREDYDRSLRKLASAVEQSVIYKHQSVFGRPPENMKGGMHNLREQGHINERQYNLNWFWDVRCEFTHEALDLERVEVKKAFKIGLVIVEGCLGL